MRGTKITSTKPATFHPVWTKRGEEVGQGGHTLGDATLDEEARCPGAGLPEVVFNTGLGPGDEIEGN